MAIGEVDDVLNRYLAAMDTGMDASQNGNGSVPAKARSARVEPVRTIANVDQRHGDGRAEILGIAILSEFGDPLHLMAAGHRTLVRISLEAHSPLDQAEVGFVMRNHLGIEFSTASTSCRANGGAPLKPGEIVTIDFLLDTPELYPGSFSFSPFIKEGRDGAVADWAVLDWIDNAVTVQMARGDGPVYGYVQLPCRIEVNARLHAEPEIA
jgi:hypothetical protein